MSNSNDELANLCLDHAWRDEIDDDTRWLLEQAARRINRLGRRCLRLSRQLEELEARKDPTCKPIRYRWWHAVAFWSCCVLASLYARWLDAWDAAGRQFKLLRDNLTR
jgi:hypothetical protein